MEATLKRVFEPAAEQDGYRVLVDRLWPRGISKEEARLDDWMKEVAPSNELRKAFHADELSWGDFRRRYLGELKPDRERLRALARLAASRKVTLVHGAKDEKYNNAVVLQQYLAMLSR